jgi:flagellar basal-body rod modification protein FlgD
MADSGSNSGTTSSSSTISANDFLTLLVTEMQNQDPTSATDPNQYINQLVSVNSLEQLIQINQTLGTALNGGTSSSSATVSSTPQASNPQSGLGTHLSGSAPSSNNSALVTSGNLATPAANPAAQRVAQALSSRTHIS